jgi:hypothetical protein
MTRESISRLKIVVIAVLLFTIPNACTENFDRINVSPTAVQQDRFNENLLFTRSLVYGALRYTEFQRAQHLYANHYIQYYATSVGFFETDRYITRNDWLTDYWNAAYADFGMQCKQAIDIASKNPDKINKVAIARIWKVFIMHRITDLWGDVPYTDAFTGKITPQYESQSEIYPKMLNELRDAVASFDPSKTLTFGSSDLIYGGSINSWIRFGNALRLRLAMRISNVAPALAEQHVKEVLNDGRLISSNTESAVMRYGRDFGNADENVQPMALIRSFNEYRASKTLVDFLQNNNDPRLRIYIDPAVVGGQFVGLQNGLSPEALNNLNVNSYSKESLIISNLYAPSSLLIYPEVLFLRAEAVVKGWATGSAQQFYEEGIRASINYWVDVNQNLRTRVPATDIAAMPVINISEADITTYLQRPAIVYNPAKALEQIITQKWLANINQGFEAYADYRRTGFPLLNPIPNAGGLSETGGSSMPVRLRYPADEQVLNRVNYQQAVANQGPDLMTTKVWWDN